MANGNPVLAALQTASFRGIAFKFVSHQEQGGRKSINFEYPNQNQRFVQDLGKYPRVFDMDCYLSSQQLDYYIQRQAFVNALNREGAGTLIHPYIGAVNVFAKPYNLHESIEELGFAVFRVQFFETDSAIFPTTSQAFESQIAGQFTNFVENNSANFINSWFVSSNSSSNLNFATGTLLTNTSTAFSVLPRLAPSSTTDQQAAFNQSLTSFNNNEVQNALNSTALASALNDLFDKAGDLSSVLSEQIDLMESLFNFSSAAPIESTTTIEDERELNRAILNQYMNATALYFDYIFVAANDYETEEDIEAQSNVLNNQFGFIVLNNTFTNLIGDKFELLTTDTLSVLQNARTNAHNYLNSLDVDSKRIIDVNVSRNSLLPLTFLYYNDLDNLQTLYDLNNVNNAANISGDFKLLTDENADFD